MDPAVSMCGFYFLCVCSRESGSAFLVPNKGRLRFRSVSVPRLHSRCAKVVMERTRKKPLTPCSFHSRSTAASTLPPFLHLLLPPHSCPHFFAQKKSPSTCRRQKGDASDMNHMGCFSWFLCVLCICGFCMCPTEHTTHGAQRRGGSASRLRNSNAITIRKRHSLGGE